MGGNLSRMHNPRDALKDQRGYRFVRANKRGSLPRSTQAALFHLSGEKPHSLRRSSHSSDTPFSIAFTVSPRGRRPYMMAARWPPRSEPQKS